MSGLYLPAPQVGLNRFGELQQPQQIGGRTALPANRLSRLFVGEAKLIDQTRYALGLL